MRIRSESTVAFETQVVTQDGRDRSCPRTLDKRLVHKAYDENVLLSQLELVPSPVELGHSGKEGASGRTDRFRGLLCVHRNHAFFFERGCGHVPALYLFEAARQMSSAVVHLFYDVPIDTEVVVTECQAHFQHMANLDDPIVAEKTVSSHVYRRDRLVSMRTTVVVRQGFLEIARLSATLVLLNKNQLNYLEQRGSSLPQCGGST